MPTYPDELFESVLALNRLIVEAESLDATLARIADITCQTIEGSDLCGVTMLDDHGKPVTTAFSDPAATEIDAAQYQSGLGPCLDAYREMQIKRWNADRNDDVWPDFAKKAKAHGVRSSLSLPLMPRSEATTGALNLYAKKEDAFPENVEPLAMLFAEQVAVASNAAAIYWKTHGIIDQLEQAVRSRDVIGQAKGMLMATTACSEDEAFALLVQQSQHENRKLHEIAAELVAKRSGAGSN